jgi:hypothetical protein
MDLKLRLQRFSSFKYKQGDIHFLAAALLNQDAEIYLLSWIYFQNYCIILHVLSSLTNSNAAAFLIGYL